VLYKNDIEENATYAHSYWNDQSFITIGTIAS